MLDPLQTNFIQFNNLHIRTIIKNILKAKDHFIFYTLRLATSLRAMNL
jgi:hypothetical protein